MKISHFVEEKVLLVELNHELDHHIQEKIRTRVDYEVQRFMPKKLIFNFKNVTFMDSAGIGFLIGRYKIARVYGGQVEIINVSNKIQKIFEMSGILKVITVKANSNVCENI